MYERGPWLPCGRRYEGRAPCSTNPAAVTSRSLSSRRPLTQKAEPLAQPILPEQRHDRPANHLHTCKHNTHDLWTEREV
ncbi:hypothetical protein ABVT39_001420 [Epinephelus coioides]